MTLEQQLALWLAYHEELRNTIYSFEPLAVRAWAEREIEIVWRRVEALQAEVDDA